MANKHRAKRKSGALDRYLQNPLTGQGSGFVASEKIKTENPFEKFKTEKKEKEKSAEPRSSHIQEQTQIAETKVELSTDFERPVNADLVSDNNMPLYCNFCDMNTICPDGRKVIKRSDQKELVICTRRNEFRQLINDAGTNSRQGLLGYIHKLRAMNSARIGNALFKESLANKGIDRNLTLLIEKQIDNAMLEYKLLTPQENKGDKYNLHITQINNAVDSFTELPQDIKTFLLQSLKAKVLQLKTSQTINTDSITDNNIFSSIPNPSNNNDNGNTIDNIVLNTIGGCGGKVLGEPAIEENIPAVDL